MRLALYLLYILLLFSCTFTSSDINELEIKDEKKLKVKEPSGITYDSIENVYYIVSDNGKLYKLNKKLKRLNKTTVKKADFEAICIKDSLLYISDEKGRKIYVYQKDFLKMMNIINLKYSGISNKGFESIAYNTKTKQFVLATEKAPIYITHYDQYFNLKKIHEFEDCHDVSDICYFNNFYYVLSDEDQMILKVDATFTTINSWKIPVVNPEGICFAKDKLVITSDRMNKVFFFDTTSLQ